MLFVGDVFMNIIGVGDPIGFESLGEGRPPRESLPVFHSTLLGSVMASLSPARRLRVSAISGAANRLPDSLSSASDLSCR